MEFQITLPLAPSINHYWRHKKYKNKVIVYVASEGKKFRQKVVHDVMMYRIVNSLKADHCFFPIEKLNVHLRIFPATAHKQDIDNRIKSTLDCLQLANVYIDDSQIDRLMVTREKKTDLGKMEVLIQEINL